MKALAKLKFKKLLVVTLDVKEFKDNIEPFLSEFEILFTKEVDLLSDFSLLNCGAALISSNSTFSWWAGEVSDHEIIIEPKVFYKDSPFEPFSLKKELSYK